jgi:DNA-binding NtrC family response regulator
MLLGMMLATLGHEVCATETTEAGAGAAVARCRPDLVIADAMLGNGRGERVLEQAVRIGPVARILMSGDPDVLHMAGATRLHKPFKEADLVDAIDRAVADAGFQQPRRADC